MEIIAINGSPRKNWNTWTLLNEALEGAKSQGAETELVNLYDLNYKGCISCFNCKRKDKEHGICGMKDDLTPILEKLKTVDGIIIGTPLYFMNFSSGMIAFLERAFFSNTIYSFEIPTVFPKKIKSAFIYTMGMPKEGIEELGIKNNLAFYEGVAERIWGEKSEKLYSYNTYQFSDYDKYESSMFLEEDKAKYKEKHFPIDCEKAFKIGSNLAKKN